MYVCMYSRLCSPPSSAQLTTSIFGLYRWAEFGSNLGCYACCVPSPHRNRPTWRAIGSLCEKMTSSTKPEVHNIPQCRWKRTEPQLQNSDNAAITSLPNVNIITKSRLALLGHVLGLYANTLARQMLKHAVDVKPIVDQQFTYVTDGRTNTRRRLILR